MESLKGSQSSLPVELVLIVDQNQVNLLALQIMLKQEGVKSEATFSSQKAINLILERIKNGNSMFKLVLLN